MKKTVIQYLIIAGFCFLIGFSYKYHLPNFKVWLIDQIQTQSQKHTPVKVLVANIDFLLFPIGINLKSIRIIPNEHLSESITTSYVDELEFSLNPISFLTGLFKFSKITIRDPKIEIIDLDKFISLFPKNSEKSDFNIRDILNYPIDSLRILRLDIKVPQSTIAPDIDLKNFSFEIENQKTSAIISFISDHLKLYDPTISETPAHLSFGSRILIQEQQVLLSALKIKKGESYIIASGFSDTPLDKLNFEEINLRIKSSLKLHQLRTEILPFLKTKKIPQLYGTLESQTVLFKKRQEPLKAETKFAFNELQVDQYIIGRAVGQMTYQNDQIKSPIIQIKNNSGIIETKDLSLKLSGNMDHEVKINIKNVQLQEFLKNLGLGETNLTLTVDGELPCRGEIFSETLISCSNANISLKNFRVFNEKQTIVSAETGALRGNVDVTKKMVKLSSDIILGKKTQGKASGFVDYEKGFYFDYDSPSFDYADSNISNLKLIGTAQLKGQTQGDSNKATFSIQTKNKDFSISDYYMGDFDSEIAYKTGILSLDNIDGLIKISKYTGKVSVDLNKNNITGQVKLPYVELSDISKAFEKKVQLPFEIYGGGQAEVSFNGPLDFSRLSYKLKSEFINGAIAGETFDQLVFDVTSQKGYVNIERSFLRKINGVMTLTGKAQPNGQISTKWIGENFSLQSLNAFNKAGINIDGSLKFDLELTDHILAPNSLFKATVSNTTISQTPVEDSHFTLSFKKDGVSGNGKLIGNQIDTEFLFPYTTESPFELKAAITDWNFAPLLHLISSRSRALEFSTLLSGKVDIKSPRGGFWNATGIVDLEEFRLQRGNKEVYSPEKIAIEMQSGKWKFSRFSLKGDNTSLDFLNHNLDGYPIAFSLSGKIDLSLISFLTPFFDDFRGIFAVSTQVGFNKSDWTFLGSGFLNSGYIRVNEFPHSFEDISADLIFSDNRIQINKLNSRFAEGRINADGRVEIKSSNSIPVTLNGQISNIVLQVPDDVVTKGSGQFRITGDFFPYLFDGTYIAQSGTITKNFEGNDAEKSRYTRSQLLPKELINKTDELVIFDVDTVFTKGIDIKNDIIDSKVYGRMKIKGPPSSPIFLGQVQLQRNGKLFFRETPFEIESGEVKFNNPNQIGGDIYISSRAIVDELRDNRIQKYDIIMLIQGTLEDFRVSLSSNPARSEKDIISLLALGVTTESFESQLTQEQVQRQSYEVGASILTKNRFGRELKNTTGLDFKVSTAIDERTKASAPKVSVTKQWTPKFGTTASRTFGDTGTNDLKVEYQLNKNMSVIGSWEGRESTNASTNTQTESQQKDVTDVLGLDLEYRFEFK